MIAVLAKSGNPQIVGQYALGVAVSAPLLVLAQFRRREPGATDIRITSLVLALLGIAAVGFLDHGVQDRLALLLIVLAESVEWIADLYAGRRGGISLALHGVLPIVALGVVFQRTGHLGAGALAVLIVRLLVLFCYDFRKARTDGPGYDRGIRVARLTGLVPCYFIAHMLGYRALGVFAAMASLLPVANGLVEALGQRVMPQLKKLYDDCDLAGFSRMSAQMGGAGLMLGLCSIASAILAGPWLLGWWFGAEYAEQTALMLTLSAVAGGLFVATLLGDALTAGRRGDERMPLEIAAVAATALACVTLVPRAGLLGAASAAGFGLLVQVIGQAWVLGGILRRPRPALLELLKARVV